VTVTTTYRARRALTDAEMTAIRTATAAAGSTIEIIVAAVHAVFTALLAPLGESLASYGSDRRLDSGSFAIPQVQWEAIVGDCMSRADAYGGRAQVAVELISKMPATYDDPSVIVTLPPPPDYRPCEHVLTVTREACDVIAAATSHCALLAQHFGEDSPEYHEAAGSWQRYLAGLFSMAFGAGTRIMRDGPLSLLVCSATGFTYGLIFHPVMRRCSRTGCQAVIDDDGKAWTYMPGDPVCGDGPHVPSYPLDAPSPGSWSFHS